ncbi:uncharacterized protein LOC9648196 [Selaginella moellendorffii]|nr:uncharacterized protein LOC9648196 [Selaginella moellendorffii]|eukprot:XP_002980498.2 uncharacterized protein LOC9648196 [Selaginella moellendorffii]
MVDPITIYVAWVGPWSEHSKEAVRSAVISLSDDGPSEFPTLSKWWRIVTQYNDSSQRPVSGNISLSRIECSVSVGNASIQLMKSAVSKDCFSVFPEDANGIYHAVISKELDSTGVYECSGRYIDAGGNRTYLYTREPRPDEYCNFWRRFGGYAGPPNGDTSLDSLISAVLASSAERATNTESDGWNDDSGDTVSSKCPSPTGWADKNGPVIEEDGVSWNLRGINGSRYIVQQLWSQKNNNCALQIIDYCHEPAVLNKPRGLISQGLIINHNVGLQPYPPGLDCMWFLSIPHSKVIRMTVNFMALGVNDKLNLYVCPISSLILGREVDCDMIKSMAGTSTQVSLPDVVHSNLQLEFKTSVKQTPLSMGWELEYRAGFCFETITTTDRFGFLSDGSPDGAQYLGMRECSWLFKAKPGSNVHLQFTRFDTVQGKDLLTVYQGDAKRSDSILEVFSGRYSVLPNRTYVGPLLLVFSTETDDGDGWAANFQMEHPDSGSHGPSSRKNLLAVILGALSGMLCLIGGVWLILRSCKYNTVFSLTSRQFSRAELDAATSNFCKEKLVAPDMFRGVLPNQQLVLIQRSMRSCEKEFELLSRIKHSNVASVLGVCYDISESFLIFKDMCHSSVFSHLFDDDKCSALSWERRVKVATQVARALGYLHTFAEPCVVHRSVSSINVYLDGSWNAKLAGFGSALSVRSRSQELKLKAEDVYRVGVFILELLMGQSALNAEEDQPTVVARWAVHVIDTGSGYEILDRRLEVPCERERSARALLKMAEIGAWCMKDKPEDRPNMMEVAAVLAQVETIFFGQSKRHSKRPG